MRLRTKFVLTYVGGFVTGVVLTFVVSFIVVVLSHESSSSSSETNVIEMYDVPTQEIDLRTFEVMQVLSDGSALAMSEDSDGFGTIVLFAADEGDSYYDQQRITVPSGQVLKQVGVYRYVSRQDVEKTVPVVQVFEE